MGSAAWRGNEVSRPYSEIRLDITAALLDGPGTCRELALRTGWSLGLVRVCLRNMVAAGAAINLPPVRVPGVRRPVPVYARAPERAFAREPADGIRDLIAAWAGLQPAAAPNEQLEVAAM